MESINQPRDDRIVVHVVVRFYQVLFSIQRDRLMSLIYSTLVVEEDIHVLSEHDLVLQIRRNRRMRRRMRINLFVVDDWWKLVIHLVVSHVPFHFSVIVRVIGRFVVSINSY